MPLSFSVKTSARSEMVDITPSVQKEVSKAGVTDGVCVAYVPHTTAGITINEGADPAVCRDVLEKLNELVPPNAGYRHMEGNADSHIKASLMGSSVSVLALILPSTSGARSYHKERHRGVELCVEMGKSRGKRSHGIGHRVFRSSPLPRSRLCRAKMLGLSS